MSSILSNISFDKQKPIIVTIVERIVSSGGFNSEICIRDNATNVEACIKNNVVDESDIFGINMKVRIYDSLSDAVEFLSEEDYPIDTILELIDAFVSKLREKVLQK